VARVHAAGDVGRGDIVHEFLVGPEIPTAEAFAQIAVECHAHGNPPLFSDLCLLGRVLDGWRAAKRRRYSAVPVSSGTGQYSSPRTSGFARPLVISCNVSRTCSARLCGTRN